MGEIVYVDLLFLINFSMDFLCFFITSRILSRRLSTPRALIGAAIGGIYADLALFIPFGRILALAVDLAVCLLISAVASYKKGRLRDLPLYTLVYLAVSMALGGFMTAIFNLLNRVDIPIEEDTSDGISVWLFALLAAISGIITLVGGRFFRRKSAEPISEIVVSYGGKSKRLCAMTDTGNLLREPISGKPCILVDAESISPILPREIVRAAKSGSGMRVTELRREDARNIRLIPIRTAGGEGSLVGVRAERIEMIGKGGAREVDAIVALSDIGRTADGSEALIPSELLIN
ncbi:MAG: hypothetical protein E7641_02145 [Ruminococcaceae bacterium]|nr:hypothetical protein [Oscillospiraceae bacterium]